MTRVIFFAACLATGLASCATATMMEQDQQAQQAAQYQAQQAQQAKQAQYMEGQQMNGQNMQMAPSKNQKSGSNTVDIINPVIIIATNAGGNSQTQQMNSPAQAPQATHTVTVGASGQLTYSPESVTANQWDMVQFNFMAKNHTVTQSTFPKPCVKMPAMPGMSMPVDSGFMPYNGTGTPPMMMVQVTSATVPMWFYCKQKKPKPHCGAGMTFSINPNMPGKGSKTQSAFKAAAIQQNGTASAGSAAPPGGAAASGMMNMGAAAAASQPPAAAASPPTAAAASQPPAAESNAAQSVSQAGSMNSMMAQGTGQSSTGGACSCSCLCGAAAFPNAMQGLGAMGGGIPGAIPAVAAGMKFKA